MELSKNPVSNPWRFLCSIANRELGHKWRRWIGPEDVAQDAWLAALRSGKPEPWPSGWLRIIVLHRIYSAVRGLRRYQCSLKKIVASDSQPAEQEHMARVNEGLSRLTESERQSLVNETRHDHAAGMRRDRAWKKLQRVI